MNYKKLLYQLKLQEDGTVSPKEDTVLKAWVRVPAGFSVITNSGTEVPPGGILNLGQAKLEDGQPVDDFNKFQQWNQSQGKGYKIDQTGEPVDDSQVTSREKDIAPGSPKKKMARTYQSDIDQYWSSLGRKVTPTSVAKMVDYRNRIEFLVNSSSLPDEDKNFIISKVDESVLAHVGSDMIFTGAAETISPKDTVEEISDSGAPDSSQARDIVRPKPKEEGVAPRSVFEDTLSTIVDTLSKFLGETVVTIKNSLDSGLVATFLGKNHPLDINTHIDFMVNSVSSRLKFSEEEKTQKKLEIMEKLLKLKKGDEETSQAIFEPIKNEKDELIGIKVSESATSGPQGGGRIGKQHKNKILKTVLDVLDIDSPSLGMFSIFPVDTFAQHAFNIGKTGTPSALQKRQAASFGSSLNTLLFNKINEITAEVVVKGEKLNITAQEAISIENDTERRQAIDALIESASKDNSGFSKDYVKALKEYIEKGLKKYPPDDPILGETEEVYKDIQSSVEVMVMLSYSEEKRGNRSMAVITTVSACLTSLQQLNTREIYSIFKYAGILKASSENYHVSDETLKSMNIDPTSITSVSEEESRSDKGKSLRRLADICMHIDRNSIKADFTKLALHRSEALDKRIEEIVDVDDSVDIGNLDFEFGRMGDRRTSRILGSFSDRIKEAGKNGRGKIPREELRSITRDALVEIFDGDKNLENHLDVFTDYIESFIVKKKGFGGKNGDYTEYIGNVALLAAHIKDYGVSVKDINFNRDSARGIPFDSLEVSFEDGTTSKVVTHPTSGSGLGDAVFVRTDGKKLTANILEQKLGKNHEIAHIGEVHQFLDVLYYLTGGYSQSITFGKSKNLSFNITTGETLFCSLSARTNHLNESTQTNSGVELQGDIEC